jgi:hypothetical protein
MARRREGFDGTKTAAAGTDQADAGRLFDRREGSDLTEGGGGGDDAAAQGASTLAADKGGDTSPALPSNGGIQAVYV